MARQEIHFVESSAVRNMVELAGAVRFKPAGRFKRLQSYLWRFLQRLGCLDPVMQESVQVTRHVVNTDNILEAIQRQRREVFSTISRPGQKLLIGYEDYSDLMQLVHSEPRYMSLQGELRGYGPEGPRVMGLSIEIIPWMRGVLVTP
jgi:hypothetical protein